MDSALGWIGQIASWLGQFVPRAAVIISTMGGVKFKNGHSPEAVSPGLVWWFPFRTEIKTYPLVRQSVDLKAQTVTTLDDKTIVVGGVLEYEVLDVLTLLTSVWSPDVTIQNIAAGCVADVLTRKTWNQLQNLHGSGMLHIEVRKEMRKRLKPYGIKVIGVTFTDFARARVYKLINSNSSDT